MILGLDKLRGAGDAVALVAKPIAAMIDKAAGTNLSNCKACDDRKEKLNQKIPFKK